MKARCGCHQLTAREFIGDRYKDLLKKRPSKIAPSRKTLALMIR